MENTYLLQYCIWSRFVRWDLYDLNEYESSIEFDQVHHLALEAFEQGHAFDEPSGPDLFRKIAPSVILPVDTVRKLCKTLINLGLDINSKNLDGQTPLLVVAASDGPGWLPWTEAFLHFGASISATDNLGRGPLHLCLKRDEFTSIGLREARCMTAKLVFLLKSGCPIKTKDQWGRTPTDLARGTCVSEVWMRALKEVNMWTVDIEHSLFREVSFAP